MSKYLTREENKKLNSMFDALAKRVGGHDAGSIIAIVIDALDKCCEGVEEREIRTLEIRINNFFSRTWDFGKGKYIDDERC